MENNDYASLRDSFRNLVLDITSSGVLTLEQPLEQIERWSGCFLGNPVCSEEHPCALHSRWKEVQQAYLSTMRRSTLGELAGREPLSEEQLETILR